MKKAMTLIVLTAILTACDRVADRADIRSEQESSLYRTAMNDYRAGNVGAAIAGFEKVVRQDPANASARFQLACLQQDAKRDHVSAYCGYREYLLQHPDSDKARLAQDRLALCEKELARDLASKYGLMAAEGLAKELEVVRKELRSSQDRVVAAEKNLAASQARVQALSAEKERLMRIVKGDDDESAESAVAARPSVKEAKDLLEESEDDTPVAPKDDVDALKREGAQEIATGTDLLPPRQEGTKPAEKKPAEAKKSPATPVHPATYVVQEGDTLYALAKRFYGTKSAWKLIRQANKAVIPMDNRLRVGDTIKLP